MKVKTDLILKAEPVKGGSLF
uniref:Uncharacterized protein n=1 Tax=Anguilla anguilla TaxID=7936 RepID=A0A0E9SBG4_ANGAN